MPDPRAVRFRHDVKGETSAGDHRYESAWASMARAGCTFNWKPSIHSTKASGHSSQIILVWACPRDPPAPFWRDQNVGKWVSPFGFVSARRCPESRNQENASENQMHVQIAWARRPRRRSTSYLVPSQARISKLPLAISRKDKGGSMPNVQTNHWRKNARGLLVNGKFLGNC